MTSTRHGEFRAEEDGAEKAVQPTNVEDVSETESAFDETKADIAGDDDEAADGGETNEDAQPQDRDVADEKVDDQQEGDTTIFLTAEAADWPQLFYARLGFETVGEITILRRRP